jgi:hypothetical protein
MGLVEAQGRIDHRLQHGGSVRDVEAESDDRSPLGEDQKRRLSRGLGGRRHPARKPGCSRWSTHSTR